MNTETIWREFRDELDGFLRKQVGNEVDAEDLRQQVYLQMHRHLTSNKPPQHLRGWVYQIARHAVIDHHRRRATRPDTGAADVAAAQPADQAPLDDDDNAQTVQGLTRCMLGMVDRLEEPQRSALRWTELDGLTQQQAAERAGVSLSGMKSRVQRGRVKLRQAMLDCCEVELDSRHNPIAHRCRSASCGCSGE